MLTPEQFIAAQKTNLDAAFGLSTKVFEGFEKLVELNVQAAKTTLSETADAAPPRCPPRTRSKRWPCSPAC
jgi:hypothetical protein